MKKIQLLAMISAVITALLIYVYLDGVKKSAQREMVNVVVAQVTIPANTEIKAEQVQVVRRHKEGILPNAERDLNKVVGKMVNVQIYPQEQILSTKMVAKGAAAGGIQNVIEKGMRAITIPVDNLNNLANMLRVGHYVDIYITNEVEVFKPGADGKLAAKQEEHTSMLLQNVKVLAIASSLREDAKVETFNTATVQVNAQDAAKLVYGSTVGKIRFALRAQEDKETVQVNQITVDNYDK